MDEELSLDLEKLEDSEHLLNILIGVENILDSTDTYCFQNWIDGEVVEGPIVRRHWITIGLRYPYDEMPDPRAALRLLKHGVQVEFNRTKQQQEGEPGQPDYEPVEFTHWLVQITVPRRLLDQMEGPDLDLYDDEVNPEDVKAAQDIGLDDESQFQSDEQTPMDQQGMPPPGMPMEQPPMPPSGGRNAPPPR